ncbi:glycoside hydrolase family 15 protein [Limimaricola pyoseonensis]|uniref:Glucoamylase (Glucan-1,4-alpha-glucosidase), GH15 family n=1 Tax=Limimaricola pyoseonensis TaxID=521013 RepID=A0A1G7IAY2_9RHOB|nr:glycoside hydrolase family 15 protein [Limimaricola pyoseonensis]SDF09815.1 Glucoamylase (glucan-1,4-alpha-glucosidase), GH15 family [Limimaricola pyoseonensis]
MTRPRPERQTDRPGGTPASNTVPIRDLGVIGDRRSAAVLDRMGRILWYCPCRFDGPSLLAGLLDPDGGEWRVEVEGARPGPRRYLDGSGMLETTLEHDAGRVTLLDWMTSGPDAPVGVLLREIGPSPVPVRLVLHPRPDYGRHAAQLSRSGEAVMIEQMALHGSHPLRIEGDAAVMELPAGEAGWMLLSDGPLPPPDRAAIDGWRENSLAYWKTFDEAVDYQGVFKTEIDEALRAIRLCTHEESSGTVAAVTTSLPEVPEGPRNWDYRYVWLRDAGMIVSALLRLCKSDGEGERYLRFICRSTGTSEHYPMAVFTDLDSQTAPPETELPLAGWNGARPVRIGNGAADQLQLDAFANVALAAKLLYREGKQDERAHWDVVQDICNFLTGCWQEPDHGIWEEGERLHYTSGKVVAACALESAAAYGDADEAKRWGDAAREIRDWVAAHCLTPEGAYAVHAGSDEVDVTAALFPVWDYCAADTPEMIATMTALERDWSPDGKLYWRRLQEADGRAEGVFVAAGFWVAQYWVMRGELERAREIIEAGIAQGNDLGLFSEEADPRTGEMLGNIPQAFAHAGLIGAVIDLNRALEARKSNG